MSRIAVGMMIAIAALVMTNGGFLRQAMAKDVTTGSASASALSTTIPATSGHRSERVLSLLIALEALRAAPELMQQR